MQAANIVKAGNLILKSKAKSVTNFSSKELVGLVEYLFFNLKHYNGAGLSAPQIGENQCILVYGFDKNPRYPEIKSIEKNSLN